MSRLVSLECTAVEGMVISLGTHLVVHIGVLRDAGRIGVSSCFWKSFSCLLFFRMEMQDTATDRRVIVCDRILGLDRFRMLLCRTINNSYSLRGIVKLFCVVDQVVS